MPRKASDVDDVNSVAAVQRRVRRVLRSTPRVAYSEDELCETIGVNSIPPIYRGAVWSTRYEYKEKTDADGVTWYYSKPHWPFWLTAGTVAFFFGMWLMYTWGGWPWWLLESAWLPGWVLRLVRAFISVQPLVAVYTFYIWTFDSNPPERQS